MCDFPLRLSIDASSFSALSVLSIVWILLSDLKQICAPRTPQLPPSISRSLSVPRHEKEMSWNLNVHIHIQSTWMTLPLHDLSFSLLMWLMVGCTLTLIFPISTPWGVISSHHLPTATRAHYRSQTDVFWIHVKWAEKVVCVCVCVTEGGGSVCELL